MALTDINSEDRLVQQTFAEHLEQVLGWQSVYAYKAETFGPNGTLGRGSERDIVLVRDLRAVLARLNPDIPAPAREQAIEKLTRIDFARSLVQQNRELYGFIRGGVPVEWRDAFGDTRYAVAGRPRRAGGLRPPGRPQPRHLGGRHWPAVPGHPAGSARVLRAGRAAPFLMNRCNYYFSIFLCKDKR